MKKKISITDVAKETGLSVTTVSQILNGKGERFSEKSRKRVLAAKKALGYSPDFSARGLVGKRGNSIGVGDTRYHESLLREFCGQCRKGSHSTGTLSTNLFN